MKRGTESVDSAKLESAAVRPETERFLRAWMQARQMVQAANFNRFHQAGLSATQFMTLNVIPEKGITLAELARRLNLSAATLSATVSSLEERRTVRRRRSRTDARKLLIHTTAAGRKLQNSASMAFHAHMAQIFSSMAPSRRDGLIRGLEDLVKAAASLAEHLNGATPHAGAALPPAHSSRRSRRV